MAMVKIAAGKASKRVALKNSGLGPQQGVEEALAPASKKKKKQSGKHHQRGNGKGPSEAQAAAARRGTATDYSALNGRTSVIYGKPSEAFSKQYGSGEHDDVEVLSKGGKTIV